MTLSSLVAVATDCPSRRHEAEQLAQELGLAFCSEPAHSNARFLLMLSDLCLELHQQGQNTPGPIRVDFLSAASTYRRRFGGGRNQALARAIGLRPGTPPPRVLDVTAGLGRDAFALACLGCTVHMVERSPIIGALLRHGLARARCCAQLAPLIERRLQLSQTDGRRFMAKLAQDQRPDTVYLDPMYPERSKSALVKKEMRALRELVGSDEDAPALLAAALACARRRVVVKRPRLAPRLEGPSPGACIQTRNTRFDIYPITYRAID